MTTVIVTHQWRVTWIDLNSRLHYICIEITCFVQWIVMPSAGFEITMAHSSFCSIAQCALPHVSGGTDRCNSIDHLHQQALFQKGFGPKISAIGCQKATFQSQMHETKTVGAVYSQILSFAYISQISERPQNPDHYFHMRIFHLDLFIPALCGTAVARLLCLYTWWAKKILCLYTWWARYQNCLLC